MSSEVTKQTTSQSAAIADWEPPMPPTDLIFDDGEPLESWEKTPPTYELS